MCAFTLLKTSLICFFILGLVRTMHNWITFCHPLPMIRSNVNIFARRIKEGKTKSEIPDSIAIDAGV